MKKSLLKFIVDAALFVDVSSLAVVGWLLALAIPRGRSNTFLGLHRHSWGDIHLILSMLLLVLLVCHLWFNWSWITQMVKRYFGHRWKNALWALAAAWIAVLTVAWIVALV